MKNLTMRRRSCTSACAKILLASLAASCSPAPSIQQFGAMRAVMREGQTEPRAALVMYESPNLFGVGAMSGLDGEVTIDDGSVWVSRVEDDGLATTGPEAERGAFATLLTVGFAKDWEQSTLATPSDGAAIEQAIAALASVAELPADGPLLVAIDGHATQVGVHVVAGACPHARPDAEAWRTTLAGGTPIRVVGVFATDREGELTHHGTRLHLHAIFTEKDRVATGHIDAISLEPGATLRIASPTAP